MKRVAHSLAWYLYWLLAFVLAFLAVLLLTVKILFEDIDSYRGNIESYLSSQMEARVHIGELQGSWNGWIPRLQIRAIAVDQIEKQPGLSVGLLSANIALDPAASLKVVSPVFSDLKFDGLKFRYDLTQAKPPELQPKVPLTADKAHLVTDTWADLLTLLLHQTDIDLNQTRVEVVTKTGKELSLSPIQLRMQHDGVLHQLLIDASLETEAGKASVNFVAEVEGNPSHDQIDFYLNIQGLNDRLLNPWLKLADFQIEGYEASQQVWGKVQQGKLDFLTGKTNIRNFKFEEYSFDELALHTALLRRDRSFQLQLTDLLIAGKEKKFNLPRISLDLVRNGVSIEPTTLMVDRIGVDQAQAWLVEQTFLPKKAVDVVKTMSPQGEIKNIKVVWKDRKDLKSFQLAADLNNVGINAWGDVPELKGINGLLTADINGGEIHLLSDDFTMGYPRLFIDKWQYPSADGVIGWRFEDKGVVVASQLLKLKNQYVSASGRFSIYLPYSRDEQPLLNLQIGLKNSQGTQAKYYIPPKEVGEKTYAWLVDAIKGGQINQAGFVLNGVTRSRLPDYQLPVVQLFFDLSDATFAYQPGWPAITDTDGFLFIRNGELTAEAYGGKLYSSNMEHAWAHLPKTTDKIFVTGAVTGDAEDIHTLLTQSPLREEVGDDLNAWKMKGSVNTQLDLNIPLKAKRLPQVEVTSSLNKAQFESEEDRIHFKGISGVVKYTTKGGLYADKLKAELFEQPVTAKIKSEKRKTQVYIDSAITASALKDWLDLDLLNIAKGTLDYQARLDMCPGKSCNQLIINSDLQGLEIDAPAPLSKIASHKMSLSVVSDLGRGYEDNRSAVRLNLGNQLRGIMVTKGQQVERARFTLGGERPSVPDQPGIWLDGHLASLDYDQLDQFMLKAGFSSDGKVATEVGAEQKGSLLKAINLEVDSFLFGSIELEQIKSSLTSAADGFSLNVESPQFSGTVLLPEDSKQPYIADLEYLHLTMSDDEDEGIESVEPQDPIDAKQLPHLMFKAKQLTVNNKTLGQWQFELLPIVNGIVVEDIQVQMPGASAKGEVRWRSENDQRSYLTLRLDGDDFGKSLDAWGVSQSLETKSLKGYLQLNWDGAPWEFDIVKSDGELQFTAKNGRLIDVGNAGNFLRVFGILNMQSLGRRLRLDFSDLLKSGVAFDEMKGYYSILHGIATTTEPFVMTGPSVNMAMKGSLDLDQETVDKDIEVALPVTDNIPLVSVLLGAPQVAGAVFLFDKLIGDPLAKFTTVKYHMSGDWGDPEIKIYEQAKDEKEQQASEDLNDG